MNRIVLVKTLPKYLLELTFEDNLCKVVDITPFIGQGLSAALHDEEYFQKVEIESGGGIYWPNGYDFCPNFLHDEVPAISLASV
ncbi:MAG: DUF2442 domain-containing protein [Anaerolineales bacterium]|nr:DUF2442 domain-containing protein [Anaerolineales bacterium]